MTCFFRPYRNILLSFSRIVKSKIKIWNPKSSSLRSSVFGLIKLLRRYVLQRLGTTRTDLFRIIIQAFKQSSFSGSDAVLVTLICKVTECSNKPFKLNSRIIQCKFTLAGQLVGMGLKTRQYPSLTRGYLAAI
jgi:hypothetical protein